MTWRQHLTRRRLLGWLAGGVGLGGSYLALGGCRRSAPDDPVARLLLELASGLTGVTRIGRRYRQRVRMEANRGALLDRLAGTLGPGAAPDSPDVAWWVLRERVRADFAAGRTVEVNGWILAKTEARLYALASTFHE